MYHQNDIKTANKTARSKGAVGQKAILPMFVWHATKPEQSILDFGAGPMAIHASLLFSLDRPHTVAHDFGDNFVAGVHDPEALSREYDVVYASNVLNVQATTEMLEETLAEIWQCVKPGTGRFICNYPRSPRKLPGLTIAALKTVLGYFYQSIEYYGRGVIICRQRRPDIMWPRA